MKNRQFWLLVFYITSWFCILWYQNNKVYKYLEVLEWRQIDIYKDTGRLIWEISIIKDNIEKIDNMVVWNYIELKKGAN